MTSDTSFSLIKIDRGHHFDYRLIYLLVLNKSLVSFQHKHLADIRLPLEF